MGGLASERQTSMTSRRRIHNLKGIADTLPDKSKVRVLFVCLGNICRSTAAQGVLESLAQQQGVSVEVDSAGTYGGHAGQGADPRMKGHARRRGYELTHRARRVRESDFSDFDIIIGMDDANISDLRRLAPTLEDEAKIFSMAGFLRQHPGWDYVPDPYYEGSEGFELVLDLLEDACQCLIDQIKDMQ